MRNVKSTIMMCLLLTGLLLPTIGCGTIDAVAYNNRGVAYATKGQHD